MPGHKMGKGLPMDVLKNLASMDLTEITGLDNLHFCNDVIKQGCEKAAQAFGADKTFFLVNGSTVGILASIMCICRPKDTLIVARDCHKSVIHGILLSQAVAEYITPNINYEFGIHSAIQPEDVEAALNFHPDAVGVLITRPTYYGICCDIKRISDIVHAHNKILIVDEAHGTHLGFSSLLPGSAMQANADICVQSAHKTLLALGQGSYLHVKYGKVDVDRLASILRMLQTSSPSYVIMSSLDVSRDIMQNEGATRLERLINFIQKFKKDISGLSGIEVLSDDNSQICRHDTTRLVMNFAKRGITGFDVEHFLYDNYKISVEMADFENVVCLCTISDEYDNFKKLHAAIRHLDLLKSQYIKPDIKLNYVFCAHKKHMEPQDAFDSKGIDVNIENAVNFTSKYPIVPYPPGISIIMPGEIISEDVVQYIQYVLLCDGKVEGIVNGKVKVIT